MSSARFIRPLARSLQQQQRLFTQSVVRSSPVGKPAVAAAFSSKRTIAPFTPSVSAQLQEYGELRKQGKQLAAANGQENKFDTSMILKAGMPQLVPFYFMNEITTTFIVLPALIYLLSKYILPRTVRQRAARLFVSKL